MLIPALAIRTGGRASSPSFPQLPEQHSLELYSLQDFETFPNIHLEGIRTVPTSPTTYAFGNSHDEFFDLLASPVGAQAPWRSLPHSPLLQNNTLNNDTHGQGHVLSPEEPFQYLNSTYLQFPGPQQSETQPNSSPTWSPVDTLDEFPQTTDTDVFERANGRVRLELLPEAPRFYQCHHCSERFPDRTRCMYVLGLYGILLLDSGARC